MLGTAALLGFGVALVPIVLTPGASFTLVSERGVSGDHRGALATIVGTGAGILTHAVLAGAGLAAVVMSSAQLYSAIRVIGAMYLIVLGLMLLWQSRAHVADITDVAENAPTPARDGEPRAPQTSMWGALAKAYVANVLNVKAAAVYLSLAPQFLTAHEVGTFAMVQLATVHVGLMGLWLGLWALGLRSVGRIIDPHRWVRGLNRVGGTVLIAMGVRTAVQ